jgi:4-hydroxy-tetrahydrodipicolinate reductase
MPEYHSTFEVSMIKVIVAGANGKMGKASVEAIQKAEGLELVAKITRGDDLAKAIESTQADVVVDFTVPDTVFANAKTIIEKGARPVIGATGINPDQIKELQSLCRDRGLGGIIAPNFSLGAILMMHFAQEASKFFEHAEIIEFHHDKKVDAPSGTAIKTSEMMNLATHKPISPNSPARGELHNQIPIHSIRLPGLFAHQKVIFGGAGETLTIQHDALDRECMMPGVVLSCKKAMLLNELVYGLDQVLLK